MCRKADHDTAVPVRAHARDMARRRLRYGHAGRDTTGQLGHDTAVAPMTRPGMRAPVCPDGPVFVLVHMAWFSTSFFDSVLFLSHRLDPVHEHCSSQNFSKFFYIKLNKKLRKNQIKFDKIFKK